MKKSKILLATLLVGSIGLVATACNHGSSSATTSETTSSASSNAPYVNSLTVEQNIDSVIVGSKVDVSEYLTIKDSNGTELTDFAALEPTITVLKGADLCMKDGNELVILEEGEISVRVEVGSNKKRATVNLTSVTQLKYDVMKDFESLGNTFGTYTFQITDQTSGYGYLYPSGFYSPNYVLRVSTPTSASESYVASGYVQLADGVHQASVELTAEEEAYGFSDVNILPGVSYNSLSQLMTPGLNIDFSKFSTEDYYLYTTDDEAVADITSSFGYSSPKDIWELSYKPMYPQSEYLGSACQIIPDYLEGNGTLIYSYVSLTLPEYVFGGSGSNYVEGSLWMINSIIFFSDETIDNSAYQTIAGFNEYIANEDNAPEPIEMTKLNDRLEQILAADNYSLDIDHGFTVLDGQTGEYISDIETGSETEASYAVNLSEYGWDQLTGTSYGTTQLKFDENNIYAEYDYTNYEIELEQVLDPDSELGYEISATLKNQTTTTGVRGFTKSNGQLYSFTGSSSDDITFEQSSDNATFDTNARLEGVVGTTTPIEVEGNVILEETVSNGEAADGKGYTNYYGSNLVKSDFFVELSNLDPFFNYVYGDQINNQDYTTVSGQTFIQITNFDIYVYDDELVIRVYIPFFNAQDEEGNPTVVCWSETFTFYDVGTTVIPSLNPAA